MDFAFSAEQEMLRSAAREFLADRYPLDRVAALADAEPGYDPADWRRLAELGWLDPELGVLEHAVLFEETGAALLPAPLFSTLALAGPLVAADAELTEAVAGGQRSAGLAWTEPGGSMDLRAVARLATRADASGRLRGRKWLVPDAGWVSDLYVVADGGEVYAVPVDGPGVRVTVRSTLDRTRRLADVELDAAPARRVADATAGRELLAAARRRALVAAAAEAVGVAQRVHELAAAHARTREQFGRVIGSYQAVSHQVVDGYVALQLARSLTYWAAWAVAEDDPDAELACAAARSAAGEAAVVGCEKAIQVHGGVGFTWESPLHRFYKRAQWLEAFAGSGPQQRAELARELLCEPSRAAGR